MLIQLSPDRLEHFLRKAIARAPRPTVTIPGIAGPPTSVEVRLIREPDRGATRIYGLDVTTYERHEDKVQLVATLGPMHWTVDEEPEGLWITLHKEGQDPQWQLFAEAVNASLVEIARLGVVTVVAKESLEDNVSRHEQVENKGEQIVRGRDNVRHAERAPIDSGALSLPDYTEPANRIEAGEAECCVWSDWFVKYGRSVRFSSDHSARNAFRQAVQKHLGRDLQRLGAPPCEHKRVMNPVSP